MGHGGMVEEIAILNIKNQACVKGGTSTIQVEVKADGQAFTHEQLPLVYLGPVEWKATAYKGPTCIPRNSLLELHHSGKH
jgi:hypothetical protein